MTDPNLGHMLIRDNSLTFGESLSKVARHELAALCLRAIGDELNRKPIPNKSRGRGRPPSPISVLALRMEVHPDSVRRWMDLREIQASDYNSEKLARFALTYNREETVKILRHDLERHREAIEGWVRRMDPVVENFPNGDKGQTQNIVASPCVENTEVEEAF